MPSETDAARVRQRFRDVFGDGRSAYLESLLSQLPQRGLSNVLSDIEEAREHRSRSSPTIPAQVREPIDL
jgi:hypothetical protein